MDKVQKMMKELHGLEVRMGQLQWTQFTVGYDFGIEACNNELMAFMKKRENFDLVSEAKEAAQTDEARREMEIAYKAFEPYHKSDDVNALMLEIENLTTALSKVLNTFRFKLDGKETTSVELAQILSRSEDRSLRKKAYLAKNQINKPMVDAGLLKLVEMRKKLAKLNGFDSFIDYRLYEDDLSLDTFDGWKDQVHELLPKMNEVRKSYAQKYLDDDKIMPWDESYVENQIAPSLNKQVNMFEYHEVVSEFFSRFDYNLDDYNITYDVFSRKNKSEWGYNFPIDDGVDSRILANVKDRFYEYNVLMHETGHGVHSFLKNPEQLILNRGVSGIVTEGIANLFGSMIYDDSFYNQFFEDDFETAKAEFKALKKWRSINAVRAVQRIFFDHEFYREECKTLDDVYAMYWRNQKDLLLEEAGDYEPPWAFLIHHTTHPIYLHNYFMGDVTCEMLRNVFKNKANVEKITDAPKAFGDFLYGEVVKPSGMYTYNELFERISGDKFTLKYLTD